jgi:hypothetical protein
MSTLPFLVPPYPGEIFGSWLSRLRLHNGIGAWKAVLRDAGYGRSDEFAFDMPDHSSALVRLLTLIGMQSYEQALLELTTLSYWLSFDAIHPERGTLPGTDSLPLIGTGKGVVKNISGIARRYRAWVGLKFCPLCLHDNFLAFGEPYWHRLHQLPNVTLCLTHQVRLLSACPECGHPARASEAGVSLPPRMRCVCGSSLHREGIGPSDGVTEAMQRLACISRDALESQSPCSDRAKVRDLLASRIRSRDMRQTIERAFSNFSISEAEIPPLSSTSSTAATWLWIRCRPHFSWLRAPDCCALLAAMKMDFASVVQFGDDMGNKEVDRRDRGRPRKTLTVAAARDELLRHIQIAPGKPASKNNAASYWLLRLRDPDWLCRHFPQTRIDALPSIESDRKSIRRSISRKSCHGNNRMYEWQLTSQSAAAHRAIVRDGAWFESQRCIHFNFNPSDLQRILPSVTRSSLPRNQPRGIYYASAIRDVLQTILTGNDPPVFPSRRELAVRAGLSYKTVRYTADQNHEVDLEIRRAQASFPRRRIVWAIKALQAQGGPMTITAITEVAHLNRNASITSIIRACLSSETDSHIAPATGSSCNFN